MKYRRSIELASPGRHAVEIEKETLATLPQWYVLHGRCRICRHETSIDGREIARRYGHDLSLANLAKRLKCQGCGNRSDNLLLLQKLPRD
ncbi:hypothetical protein [Rhizobium leguminosarum]|jgi:hypothetical protein|uniref:hypothetical protein n=1 Tax=Rhizobium leguminosarum TaxID=384 RepID=UPI0015C048B3|nr:hypothetical protein [Rhizobium leguminosarum]MBY5826861.1 hypothetical protein [Rhizobium leguminosarum]